MCLKKTRRQELKERIQLEGCRQSQSHNPPKTRSLTKKHSLKHYCLSKRQSKRLRNRLLKNHYQGQLSRAPNMISLLIREGNKQYSLQTSTQIQNFRLNSFKIKHKRTPKGKLLKRIKNKSTPMHLLRRIKSQPKTWKK